MIEERAKSSLSTEDERLAQVLVVFINAANGSFNTNKDTYNKKITEIKKIGEHLCAIGGNDRMLQVAYRIQMLGARVRDCELFWEGICGWKY